MLGITIGEKHTGRDWGLNLTGIILPMPEPKYNTISIPGFDGSLDLTEFSGRVVYENREGVEFHFSANDGSPEAWLARYSEISNYLHGQRRKVILDTDLGYYYMGRMSINEEKTDYYMSEIVIGGTLEPYKYDLQSSLDDWLWDSFNFVDGVIREYKDIAVDGTLTIIIPGREMPVVPTILVSTPMTVAYKGKNYALKAGSNKIYGISIMLGENTLTFMGTGMVTIEYRGGRL